MTHHDARALLAATVLAATLVAPATALAGDPVAGQEKAATCAACHGPDGNSPNPMFPRLAGQWADYLEYALEGYKNGSRQNPIMAGLAAGLSAEDRADLAAFYATQPPAVYTAR